MIRDAPDLDYIKHLASYRGSSLMGKSLGMRLQTFTSGWLTEPSKFRWYKSSKFGWLIFIWRKPLYLIHNISQHRQIIHILKICTDNIPSISGIRSYLSQSVPGNGLVLGGGVVRETVGVCRMLDVLLWFYGQECRQKSQRSTGLQGSRKQCINNKTNKSWARKWPLFCL